MADPRHAMDVILRIPDDYRRFDQPADKSSSVRHLGDELVGQLLELGMPHRVESGIPHFDRLDIENVSMLLGLPSLKSTTMRLWSSALDELPDAAAVRYRLIVAARCPRPGHTGACDFRLADWLTGAPGVCEMAATGPGMYELTVTLAADHHVFDGRCAEVVGDVRSLCFCFLPPELGRDLDFVARTGLADCRLVAHYLLAAAERRNVSARKAAGLFIARPLAMRHNWIELFERRSARWLPADPFTLGSLAGWGAIDATVWPPERALNGVLLAVDRVAFFGTWIITHGEDRLRPAIRVRPLATSPAPGAAEETG